MSPVGAADVGADPFGTRALRRAVLDAWLASPARFREDANAEEDHARGWYRDRVVVELAQNAADAAHRADQPGRLRLSLAEHIDATGTTRSVLLAANTGHPLDAPGVAALASLRASAKRADDGAGRATVGRFGVGFAAVRAVSDDVVVVSRTGAVRFSLTVTREALADLTVGDVPGSSDLAAEVARRGTALPALRLPFAHEGPVAGLPAEDDPRLGGPWDTVVVLVLTDDAVPGVRAHLAEVDDALLLALESLDEVEVEDGPNRRVLVDVHDRWLVARRTGRFGADLLADRPVEERTREQWEVLWAVPRSVSDAGVGVGVMHAPTPTDEPCSVPAVLIGTFPLDPSRRHVVAGPVTDALVEEAALAFGDLLARRDDALDPWDLLPTGMPAGSLDAALREAIDRVARGVPFLRPLDGGPALAPTQAAMLAGPGAEDRGLLGALARSVPRMVDLPPGRRSVARRLGVEELALADVVDSLPSLDPAEHRELLDAVGSPDARILEALATLPVPLADGRTVRGLRGVVVFGDLDLPGADRDVLVERLADWGVRAVHPDAAHPLHERLGASTVGVDDLLRLPGLRERVLDGDEPAAVAEAMLLLLRARGAVTEPGPAWWGEVLLPADDGEWTPARGLVLPESPAAGWFDDDVLVPVDAAWAERWGSVLLAALGVREGLAVVSVPGEAGDPGGDEPVDEEERALVVEGLDGWDDYLRAVDPDDVGVAEQVAVGDLDAVVPDAWSQVLDELASGPALRALEPVRCGATLVPSWTSWWLRRRSGLVDGPFRIGGGSDDDALARLLPTTPPSLTGLPTGVLRRLGGVDSLAEVTADEWPDLLTRLGDVGAQLPLVDAVLLWRGLAAAVAHAGDPAAHLDVDAVPALAVTAQGESAEAGPATATLLPTEDVVVADPQWVQLVRPALVVPRERAETLADALDVDLAWERADGHVTSRGVLAEVPADARALVDGLPERWWRHERLEVDGGPLPYADGDPWWVEDDEVHAQTVEGAARGLAVLIGWGRRDTLARLLVEGPGFVDLAGEDR